MVYYTEKIEKRVEIKNLENYINTSEQANVISLLIQKDLFIDNIQSCAVQLGWVSHQCKARMVWATDS